MTIACLGITVLDRIFRVPQLPHHGGKYIASDYFEVGGGPAATAAVAIKKLGYDVEFIGRVGSDSVAETMTEELTAWGVQLSYLHAINDAKSSFSAVLVDDEGERMIINYQDGTLSRDVAWLETIDFSKFNALLCDVRWFEGARYALSQAKQHGVASVLDADLTAEPIDELVALADHCVFSEPGLEKLTGCANPIEGLRIAQKLTSGKVYVTVGSDGCYWLENDEVQHLPGFKVDVVDTTGAGDVFHGAFTAAIAQHASAHEAVRFSSAVAALKCTKPGGRAGIPTAQHVDAFLSSHV